MSNTRTYLRVSTNIPAEITSGNNPQPISAKILNLSFNGFLIESSGAFDEGTQITVTFQLPGFLHPFVIPATVARTESKATPISAPKYTLGLQISELPDLWKEKIPLWIKDLVEAKSIRRKACLFLGITALGLLFKATASACEDYLTSGNLKHFEFLGLMRLFTNLISNPYLNLALACLLSFAAWHTLTQSHNKRFFNTLLALSVSVTFLIRLVLKVPLLSGGKSHLLVYGGDLFLAICSYWGTWLLFEVEKTFRYYEVIQRNEKIAPHL